MIPESGLPFLLFNVFLFVLLLNTLAGSPDRISVLRSLAVIVGAAFMLKFVVLAAMSDPGGGALKRVLLALLEGVTLGTLEPGAAASGNRLCRLRHARAVSGRHRHAAAGAAGRTADVAGRARPDKIGRVMPRVFLLSPANCRGRRAQQVLSPKVAFPVAARLRADGVPIGELFAHMSGLYFRGKITYAQTFGRAFVITPDQGLVPADLPVTSQVLIRFADADISLENPGYRAAARAKRARAGRCRRLGCGVRAARKRRVREICAGVGRDFRLASGVSAAFVGRGDMSRGGLLLRAAAAGEELDYVPVLGAVRRGTRPPKLEPLEPAPPDIAEPSSPGAAAYVRCGDQSPAVGCLQPRGLCAAFSSRSGPSRC